MHLFGFLKQKTLVRGVKNEEEYNEEAIKNETHDETGGIMCIKEVIVIKQQDASD